MLLSDAIRKRIEELMKSNGLKYVNSLSNLAGISNSLNDFMNGKTELPKIDTILHICEGFEIQLVDFFNSPLFEDVQYEKSKK